MDENNEISILIVDDNPQNLQLFGSVLKKNGYKPLLAQNGMSAISFVERTKPDLILLDVMMPGMNGYQVCEHLRDNPETSHIPIIFITAKTEQDDILNGFNVGGVDYIAKPFNIPELLARVKTHVDLKRARDLISNQTKELKVLNASKDRLFSIIGHDLRNPFGGIISFSSLLMEEYESFSDEERVEMITTFNKAANQGVRLLENLLDWSRSHSGLIEFKPIQIVVSELVNLCVDLLRPFSSQKGIALETNIDSGILMIADSEMVNTIIRNLISNAIKFTPVGGKVSVSAEQKDSQTIIHVRDTGVGIPATVQHKILAVGEKYSSLGTELEEGTGLGLLLVQEFIRRHNGTIWFDSEEGNGAVFSVSFPS